MTSRMEKQVHAEEHKPHWQKLRVEVQCFNIAQAMA